MSARIIPFPPRGPFTVSIEREGHAWLVVSRQHGWLCGSREEARAAAEDVANGFGVAVEVRA
jgi:hypothetical protein